MIGYGSIIVDGGCIGVPGMNGLTSTNDNELLTSIRSYGEYSQICLALCPIEQLSNLIEVVVMGQYR